jgi:single-stranded-DNA-specific exonuclease
VQNNILYRTHDIKCHGLLLDTIPDYVSLVIAPDSSSNEYEIHQALKEKNIDVLVIDHHEAEYISPYACVINN